MPLNRREEMLVEAVKGFLSSDPAKLGLETHDDVEETSHIHWHQWENIDDEFALKVSDSAHFEGLTSSFYAIHSYKRLGDPTFNVALDAEMRSRGIPAEVREQTIKYVDQIIENYGKGNNWDERDAGWNPNLDEIAEMTRNADDREAKTSEPHTGGGPAPAKDELADGYKGVQ